MEIRDCMKQKVFSVPYTATIRQAAAMVANHHIGLLPVVDEHDKPQGVIRLGDLLSLELPDFFNLLADLDFVHDFGALESTRLTAAELDRPVTSLMHPVTWIEESSGLMRAYALMVKQNLYDLLVVSAADELVGIVSRVDIGAAILSGWESVK